MFWVEGSHGHGRRGAVPLDGGTNRIAVVVDARELAPWTKGWRGAATRDEWEAAPISQRDLELELRHGGTSRDGSCIKMARAGGEKVENVRLHARNQETAGICDEFRDWEWSSAGVNLAPQIAGFG